MFHWWSGNTAAHLTGRTSNSEIEGIKQQESPADARVMHDSVVIPRWPSAAIMNSIDPEIAPFDPPTPETLD